MPKKKRKSYSCEGKSEDELLADLYMATKDGIEAIVQTILENGKIDINRVTESEKSCQGLTALHMAARYNQLNSMKCILSADANVNAADAFGFRPIHDAALFGHFECLNELLTHGATTTGVERPGLERLTPLYYAAQQSHISCVVALKERTPDVDSVLLEMSSKRGNTSIMELTEKENIHKHINVVPWWRNSALCGHVKYWDFLKKLIPGKFGSKETLQSIITATQHDKLDYLTRLLESGIDPNTSTEEKATALHYAARYGHVECIELLVKYGADINAKTVENWTPLHTAIRECCTEGVDKLIQCGCNIDETGGDSNDTPIHTALKLPVDDETMKAVLKGKPALTIKNKDGLIPTEIKCSNDALNELVKKYARN